MKKLLLILISLLYLPVSHGQEVKIIKLKQKPVAYKPVNFHVSKVVDDRSDTTNIGFMRAGLLNKIATINLENGTASAIGQFIENNVKQDRNTTPVELHLTQLTISEKPNRFNEQVDLAIGVAFYEAGNKLIEYNGTAYAQTNKDASVYIESLIRSKTEDVLKQFDNWRSQNASTAGVSASVEIDKVSDNEDLIYYNIDKPLKISDFKGEPDDLSMGAAATGSGIGMKYTHQRQGMAVTLKVTLFSYFDRSRSWCKPEGRNDKTLSHEQRHFDISAIKCYELAKAIEAYQFSTDNYVKELDNLMRQYDKELGKMQQQYDQETKHGTNRPQQQAWDTDIRTQLTDKKL